MGYKDIKTKKIHSLLIILGFLPKRKVFFNKCGGHIKGHSLTKKLAALSSESGSSEGAGGAGASCVAGAIVD